MTITETLSQEAEQPGEQLAQSKEHLERLTAREKWTINEQSRGNKDIFFSQSDTDTGGEAFANTVPILTYCKSAFEHQFISLRLMTVPHNISGLFSKHQVKGC